jgi:3-dehydroshikimate dehydratase
MALFTLGLVSVTFRQLSPAEIIALAAKAGLQTLEWGGDIHVPHGDLARAREAGRQTVDAGLTVAAYGSYYCLGQSEGQGLPFGHVLESATALGAPTIRVWAGAKGSLDTSAPERKEIIRDAWRAAQMAREIGKTISLEYHGGSLTDRRESVVQLMAELPRSEIQFSWQPPPGESQETCAARLKDVLPRLGNIHVFHWWPTSQDRRPLAEGELRWKRYIDIVREAGKPACFLLEFVAHDSLEQLVEDAAVLRRLLSASGL